MGTPIPAFVSQYLVSSLDTVRVNLGTIESLSSARWYYLVSNRTAASNGQSLLKAIKDQLDASLAGTIWTVQLSASNYKVQLSHDNGSSRNVTFGNALRDTLGFQFAGNTVGAGTTLTADYPSRLWWSPNMPVSMTGPVLFDPSINYGIPSSAGASQRSPDSTAAYVSNGTQYEAEYTFTGVDGYYRVRPQSGYTNQDFETWWKYGPRLGRRILMWRDRTNATGSNAPSEGSASPYNYVEYNPQDALRAAPLVTPLSGVNLVFWTVNLPFWVTENGETPLSD